MPNVRVVILGLLCKGSLYGYEIKQRIEEYMGDWTDIRFGSIYFALDRMNEGGYVTVKEEVVVGNRPTRKVYDITEKGRNEYLKLLRNLWTHQKRIHYPLDIAVFFMQSLPQEEIVLYLQERIKQFEHALAYLAEHERENKDLPRQGAYIFDHSRMHLKAELDWLCAVLNDIRT